MNHPRRLHLVAAAALLAAGGWAWAEHDSARARALTARHLAELEAARAAWSFDREAPWGETRDEAAWPHYAAALARFASQEPEVGRATMQRILEVSTAGDDGDPQRRAQVLARYGDVLEDVRRGAHARDARVEIRWEEGFTAPVPKLRDCRSSSNLAVLNLVEAAGTERELDAIRGLLDAQQMACDLAESPLLIAECIGLALIVPPALGGHLQDGLAARLSVESKREWLAGLRRLEAGLSRSSQSLLGEAELAGRSLSAGFVPQWSTGTGGVATRLEAWRNGLFLDRQVADHLGLMRTLHGELARASALPGPEALARVQELQALHGEGLNAVSSLCLPRILSVATSRASARTRLAVLRHALELHLGDQGTLPEDAFGSGVFARRASGRVMVVTTVPLELGGPTTLEVSL